MSGIRQNDSEGNRVEVVAEKDPGGRYLAWRVANHIAATIAREKPSTLMNLSNSCGELLDLWDEFKEDIFYGSNIEYYELGRKDTNVFVLFFCRHKLNEVLGMEEIKQFLSTQGYGTESLEDALNVLKSRYTPRPFPHEIGVFLGIPLKDVKAFMGLSPLPHTSTSMWRVYGDSRLSLQVMRKYRRAENMVRKLLSGGGDPIEMINRGRIRAT